MILYGIPTNIAMPPLLLIMMRAILRPKVTAAMDTGRIMILPIPLHDQMVVCAALIIHKCAYKNTSIL
jgi:hypothetical protein